MCARGELNSPPLMFRTVALSAPKGIYAVAGLVEAASRSARPREVRDCRYIGCCMTERRTSQRPIRLRPDDCADCCHPTTGRDRYSLTSKGQNRCWRPTRNEGKSGSFPYSRAFQTEIASISASPFTSIAFSSKRPGWQSGRAFPSMPKTFRESSTRAVTPATWGLLSGPLLP